MSRTKQNRTSPGPVFSTAHTLPYEGCRVAVLSYDAMEEMEDMEWFDMQESSGRGGAST